MLAPSQVSQSSVELIKFGRQSPQQESQLFAVGLHHGQRAASDRGLPSEGGQYGG